MPAKKIGAQDKTPPVGASPRRRVRHASPSPRAVMPMDVTPEISWFDAIANRVEVVVSHAAFFLCCLAMVVLWVPSYWFFPGPDKFNAWQLVINTTTTIITFLLVALLQNTQYRAMEAMQHKLNAISSAMAHVLAQSGYSQAMETDIDQLEAGVGLEDREST
jgi:hypothetical protein